MDNVHTATGDGVILPEGAPCEVADISIPPGEKKTHTPRRKKDENEKYTEYQIQLLRDFLERQKTFFFVSRIGEDCGMKPHRLDNFIKGAFNKHTGAVYYPNMADEEIDRLHDFFLGFRDEINDYFDSLHKPKPPADEKEDTPPEKKRAIRSVERVRIPKCLRAKIIKTSWWSFKVIFKLQEKKNGISMRQIHSCIKLINDRTKGKLVLKGYGASHNDNDKELGRYTVTISYQIKLEEPNAKSADH